MTTSTQFDAYRNPLLAILGTLRLGLMSRLRARVENGRLLLDKPTTLPDGAVVELGAAVCFSRRGLALRLRLVVASTIFLCFGSCHDGVTTPTRSPKPVGPFFYVRCSPDGLSVRCVAVLNGTDITNTVDWWASEEVIFANESDAVVFEDPGVLTATRPTTVYIRTRGRWIGVSPLSYAVGPSSPAEARGHTRGQFRDEAGGELANVSIEIVEGADKGKAATPILNPSEYLFDHLQLWAPRTFRASKAGYQDEIQRHSGIEVVDGYPRNTSLHFRLKRVTPAP